MAVATPIAGSKLVAHLHVALRPANTILDEPAVRWPGPWPGHSLTHFHQPDTCDGFEPSWEAILEWFFGMVMNLANYCSVTVFSDDTHQ
jgi:hypothetical protein